MKSFVLYSLVAIAAALTIAGCGGGGSSAPIAAPTQNTAPIANGGNAQSVVAGSKVTLSASGSSDADGDALTYVWTLSNKPAGSAASLTGITSSSPTFVADLAGTYVASLIVNDGKVDSTPVMVTITAATVVGFDSLTPLPPNMPSYGPEAYALTSLGDRITLKSGFHRTLNSISVGMSSWACQSGGWNTNDCLSAANSTFSHPVTLRVYDSSGTQVATLTQTFNFPYRPSASTACTGGRWLAPNGTCYNGFASEITFDLSSLKVTLPDNNFSYDLSYNTNTQGPAPLHKPGPYDSLNIGTYSLPATPSVGSAQQPGYIVWNGVPTDESGDGVAGIMTQVQVTAP